MVTGVLYCLEYGTGNWVNWLMCGNRRAAVFRAGIGNWVNWFVCGNRRAVLFRAGNW